MPFFVHRPALPLQTGSCMDHHAKTAIAIIVTLVLAVAAEIFLIGRSGGSDKTQSSEKRGKEEAKTETVFFQSDRISEIKADLSSCDLKFSQWDESRIELTIASDRNEDDRPYALLKDNAVVIAEDRQEHTSLDNTSIDIRVPRTMPVEINNFFVSVKTTGGAVSVNDFTCGVFDVKTAGGKIVFDSCSFTALSLESETGTVVCTKTDAHSAHITSKSGRIRYAGSCDYIDAASKKGGINFSADAMMREASFECERESINIALHENDGYTLEYAAPDGKVKDAFTNTDAKGSGSAQYKNGAASIKVKTESGNINITRSPSSAL